MTGPERDQRRPGVEAATTGLLQRRLHVLHVAASATGDVADQVLEHVRDQVERGWTVTVACPSLGGLGFVARGLGARVRWWSPDGTRPTPPTTLRAIRGARALAAGARLRRTLADIDADVVHLHGGRTTTPGRLALRGRVPTVFQAEGLETPPASMHAETFAQVGVDVTRWRASGPGDRPAARARLGLDRDAPLAVWAGSAASCVGHLAEVEVGTDVWADVRTRVRDARLVLIGPGSPSDDLGALVGRAGITVAGDRTDLADWFAAADVVVVPTRSAGRSVTALKAMASARSVVVTGGPGVVRLVLDGGGALAAPDGPAALGAALERRLGDPVLADEEGWQARRHVERHHDSVQVSRDLARVYPRLVAARRA